MGTKMARYEEDPRFAVTNDDLDQLDVISNPEAAGYYPTAQIGVSGKVKTINNPPCELCGMPATISTQRLVGDTSNNPRINLCGSCDKKYHEALS